jgi:hypothetical protein
MRRYFAKLGTLYDAHGALFWGAAALVLVLAVLFGGKHIGLSDNGDFKRVMDTTSLAFSGNETAYTFNDTYRIILSGTGAAGNTLRILFDGEGFAKYPSLQVPIVRVSVVLNLLVNRLSGSDLAVYRLEVLGALYALLLGSAIAFLTGSFTLPRRGFDLAAKALLLIVLCDVGYLAYFDSFYGEALQYITLIFLSALLVRVVSGKPGLREAVWCALGCVAFGMSKFFNIPAACAFIVLLEGLILLRTKKKAPAVVSGAAALLVLAAVLVSVPAWMGLQTKFNAVFFGALRGADENSAEKYLDELKLPGELKKYADKNIYVDGVALELEQSGRDKAVGSVSEFRLGLFYLNHPEILWRALDICRLNAGSIRPFYLGNYGDSAPKLTMAHRFSVWSDARSALGFDTWTGIAGVLLAFGIALVMVLRRSGMKTGLSLLVLTILAGVLFYFFAGPYVSNGEGDLSKHLFAFEQTTDLMILFVLTVALYELAARKKRTIPVTAVLMTVFALLIAPVSAGITDLAQKTKAHTAIEAGAYVEFGTYHGSSLVWRVTGTDGAVISLLCTETVGAAAFSESDGNTWASSSLRAWLNGEFLQNFSATERVAIKPADHNVLLSHDTKNMATSGGNDFYFSPIPILAGNGTDSAYRLLLRDEAALPDAALISDLAKRGAAIALPDAYWLDTPYFNNGYMVRCVLPDGAVLMREADETCGVRPVLHIETGVVVSGNGSYRDPFVLS